MAKIDTVLKKVRDICLSLPDTKETVTWGNPHFRVGDKIFAGFGTEKGKLAIGFKLHMDHADARIQDPRFWRSPYVGHKGWVSMDATQIRNWRELRSMILESYTLIAPKRSLAKLEATQAAVPKSPRKKKKRTASTNPTQATMSS
jgi:predicted DNA-binding protein (MmcQ/YjbR family)